MIKGIYYKNIQFIKYAFFGGLGVFTDMASYSLLILYNINYQFANAFGYLFGTIVSFLLNRALTFNSHDKIWLRFFKFLSVAFVGFTFSAILLYVLVDIIVINAIIAKIITLLFVLVTQFTLNKKYTFKVS